MERKLTKEQLKKYNKGAAQYRADFLKKNYKAYTLRFHLAKDADIIEFMDNINKTDFIRKYVRGN